MEMIEVGSLRKAVYDFNPENDKELALEVGDIIQVLKWEDKQWCYGMCNGRKGDFPISFTIDLKIPPLEGDQQLFAPITKFVAQENGDLSLNKGDLIIGIRAVDNNWWEGKCNNSQGIFPLNYVWKIDRTQLMKANAPRKVHMKARVKQNLKAQLPEEISLVKDDIVIITEKVDKLWYRGECNGKKGIFPGSYVTIISESDGENGAVSSSPDSAVKSKPNVLISPVSADGNDVHSIMDQTSNQCGYDCLNSGIAAYGQALFPFDGEQDGDLSFRKGELVNLIRYVNNDWMEGEVSGRTGIFPKSYVKVIVDCPNLANNSNSSNDTHAAASWDLYPQDQLDGISQDSDSLPPSYADVMQADSRFSHLSHDTVLNPTPRLDRPLSYPSATFVSASFSADQNNFSYKSVPNIEDKIGENLSCLDSLSSSSAASSTNTSRRSMSFNEPSIASHAAKPEAHPIKSRPAYQPTTYDNVQNMDMNTSDAFSNDTHSNDAQVSSRPSREPSGRLNTTSRAAEAEIKRRAEERMKKMREQRNCIITEIFQTERDYRSDLEILCKIFVKCPDEEKKNSGIDEELLFGNLEEVIEVSKRLMQRLDKVKKDSYENQMIGQCFIDMADEMKEVYGHYCRNHDEVNAILDKYEDNSAACTYLRHKVELMKRETNCFDLPSMLIKPVQRILKYPLLLNELVKVTEDDHRDKQSLIEAISLMTDVATAINEFKRKKDLVFKYRKHSDTSFSERISKFNMHSMLKKSARIGTKISQSIGLTHVTKDENFLKVESQFRALEKTIKIFMKDVTLHMEKKEELVKTAFNIAEDIAEFYGERKTQQEVDALRSVHRIISTQHWNTYKTVLERNVLDVLKQLLLAFEGPNNVIAKRSDKLLDYDACSNKLDKNRDGTKVKMLQDNLQVAKNTYEALNSQLLDDLPKLYSESVKILQDCVLYFLKAKKQFAGNSAKEMLDLSEQLELGSHSGILDTFQVKHNLVTDNLGTMNIVPKQFFSQSNTSTLKRNSSPVVGFGMSAQSKTQQSPSDIQRLKSTYFRSLLYAAIQDYDAIDMNDVSLSKGDIVGVVKEKDPMGNKQRWYVDKGGSKGFVPRKILQRYIPSAELNAWGAQQDKATTASKTRPKSCYPEISRNVQTRQQQDLLSDWQSTSSVQTPKSQASTLKAQQSVSEISSVTNISPLPPTVLNFNLLEASKKPDGGISPTDTNLNTSDEQPHKYEEIDEILGLYDPISPDTCVKNQPLSSPSTAAMSLAEFDPYGPLREHAQLYDNVPTCEESSDASVSHRYEEIPDGTAEVQAIPDVVQYYFAMYDFSPTGTNQLKVMKGQVVRVISKCDLSQNPEWWLAEDRYGNQGYVPANYLKEYPCGS